MKIKMMFAGAVLAISSLSADANTFFGNDGIWYGNVCRTGAYYSVIAFAPIGSGCWNYGWGTYGVVSGS